MLRKDRHLKQSEFGEMFDVSGSYVSCLECGKEIPSKKLKMLICEKINVSMEWLETGKGHMYLESAYLRMAITNDMKVRIDENASMYEMSYMIAAAIERLAEQELETRAFGELHYGAAVTRVCMEIGEALFNMRIMKYRPETEQKAVAKAAQKYGITQYMRIFR